VEQHVSRGVGPDLGGARGRIERRERIAAPAAGDPQHGKQRKSRIHGRIAQRTR